MRKKVIEDMKWLIEKKKKDWIDKGYPSRLIEGALEMAYDQTQRMAGVEASYRDDISIEELQSENLPRALNNAETWMRRLRERVSDGGAVERKAKERLEENFNG